MFLLAMMVLLAILRSTLLKINVSQEGGRMTNFRNVVWLVLVFLALNSKAELNVIAVGDTGKGNSGQFQVGQAMARECRQLQCDFALLLGDNIYDVGLSSPSDPQMIEKFEKPYAEFPQPFYVALGNHDYGKLANEWQRGDYQIEYSKKNPKYVLPSHYYAFVKNDVLFIVLDTSRYFHDKDSQQQTEFVKKQISESKAKWKVVVAHHPFISNGKHGNAGHYDGVPFPPYSGSVIKKLVENELCGKIDIYISGHDHNLQTLQGRDKCSSTLFVVSGTGASGDDKLNGRNSTLFQSSELGFSSLSFLADRILVRHHGLDGRMLHSHVYKKPNTFLDYFKTLF